jgi:hypothetical protein
MPSSRFGSYNAASAKHVNFGAVCFHHSFVFFFWDNGKPQYLTDIQLLFLRNHKIVALRQPRLCYNLTSTRHEPSDTSQASARATVGRGVFAQAALCRSRFSPIAGAAGAWLIAGFD